jgi:tripartite-type tricarboxylate transporter receptor subunit TctC
MTNPKAAHPAPRTSRRKTEMKLTHLLLASSMAITGAAGTAAADFPADQPIRLISPYGAGGAVDIASRILSSVAGEFLDTRVDVISIDGAGGQEAISLVRSAPADGYTLLVTDYGPLITTALQEDVDYTLDEWVPIVQITEVAPVFFARADSAHTDMQTFIDLARANPGSLSVAHGRYLSVPHLPLILLQQVAGFETNHIPTTGGGQALAFGLGGTTDAGASVPSTIAGGVGDGSLVALALATADRVPGLPNTPTLRELGYEVVMPAWYTIFAHRDVPADRLAILEERIIAALSSRSAQALGQRTGTDVRPLGMEASMEAYLTTIANLEAILATIN